VVAAETRDDAAVYRLPDGRGLVQTVDFFTPVVDDPFDWGRIAAANAFSDVYAMGGSPAIALNVAAWPVEELPLDMLKLVLDGGAKVAAEAGVSIVGGHTIHDPEPKYGMAVTGFVDLDRIVRNSTAPGGARLFLTKPLGIGMITTALKRGKASEAQVAAAVETMTRLNAAASEAMVEAEVEAATDVTGYGFLGHLHFMLAASGMAAEIDASTVPLLPGTLDLAEQGTVASGSRKNHAFLRDHVDWGELGEAEQLTLADAQTSGGLLIAVSNEREEALREALTSRNVSAAEVGRTREGEAGRIFLSGRVQAG
jgi:selenide,water dikinase